MGKKDKSAVSTSAEWQKVEQERITEIIVEVSKRAPIQVAPYIKQAAPTLAYLVVLVMMAMPHIAKFCSQAKTFFESLPDKVVGASIGFAICFFGGIFPMTIAAVEAWQLCGGAEAKRCIMLLYEEGKKVQLANAEDEASKGSTTTTSTTKVDIPAQELMLRKTQLVLKTVEPETVSKGIVGLYTGWIAVLAVLRNRFAKTVTLGERIGAALYEPMKRFEPAIEDMTPEEYRKWIPVAFRWSCKLLAMSVAWWIQRVISATHSAIKGGLIFGRYLVEFLHEKNIVSFPPEKAYLDECIGW
eukprot:CAMPEP_0206498252 /NCGR_PEP_ID=MMETSP0324_2-20121206/50836_1 /ASSEMBLY_ACC=CAM_ASM_000836 /TAXON_ID=2866 /ORGANISM="Crypthecodinium cohnii, Strain Seligo" /LENGTH=299 /DNA_ID=CAMNT_0053984309 /DNA_START=148 /DNA_END=1044 /DNA_ORIENTATION=-